jgi:hypothetical protein
LAILTKAMRMLLMNRMRRIGFMSAPDPALNEPGDFVELPRAASVASGLAMCRSQNIVRARGVRRHRR